MRHEGTSATLDFRNFKDGDYIDIFEPRIAFIDDVVVNQGCYVYATMGDRVTVCKGTPDYTVTEADRMHCNLESIKALTIATRGNKFTLNSAMIVYMIHIPKGQTPVNVKEFCEREIRSMLMKGMLVRYEDGYMMASWVVSEFEDDIYDAIAEERGYDKKLG